METIIIKDDMKISSRFDGGKDLLPKNEVKRIRKNRIKRSTRVTLKITIILRRNNDCSQRF
jgi:hypothetical protein